MVPINLLSRSFRAAPEWVSRCPYALLALCWLALLSSSTPLYAAPRSTATIYVSRGFEVRDHDQPVKYVLAGDSRVARVTGPLSTNLRVQRLRLFAGWNLCSVAVTATNALAQITNSQPPAVSADSVYLWFDPEAAWEPLLPNQTLPAGSVLWVRAATNSTLAILGSYVPPANVPVTTNGTFVAGAGLEPWDLQVALQNASMASAHLYEPATQSWLSRLHLPFDIGGSAFPFILAPGSAAFIQSPSPALLEVPDSILSIRYYHNDHLGSASITTDQAGMLVEETSFYPFGVPRHEFQPRAIQEPYQFTGKERDRETGLYYYEARYLASTLSRFTRVDDKYAHPEVLNNEDFASLLTNPQRLNLYAYVLNNPLKYIDPTGMDDRPAKSQVLVVYTKDMLDHGLGSMKISNQAAYENALKATYAPEAGPNANILVKRVDSWRQLGNLLKGKAYDVVVVNTHAFGNDKSLFIGKDKNIDVANVNRLEGFLKGAKTPPKKIFFYGCNSASSGLAPDLSKRFPGTEVTGATTFISQEVDFPDDTDHSKAKIKENRNYNVTFKDGEAKADARKADPNAAAISRDDFR